MDRRSETAWAGDQAAMPQGAQGLKVANRSLAFANPSLGSWWRGGVSWIAARELWIFPLLIFPLMFPSRWTFLVLPIVAVLWFSRWAARGRLSVRTALDLPIALLLVMTAASLYISVDPELSWPKVWGIVLGVATYYSLVNSLRTDRAIWIAAWVLVGSGIGVALLGLVGTEWSTTKLFALPWLYDRLPQWIRGVPNSGLPGWGSGFHPNEVGGALAMLAPLPVALLFTRWGKLRKSLLGLAAVATISTLFLTQSRSALLGLALAVLLIGVWWRRWFLLTIPAAGVGMAIVVDRLGLERVVNYLLTIDITTGVASATSRIEVWQRAAEMVRDMPFTGVGLNTFPLVMDAFYPSFVIGPAASIPHAHNLYLQVAVDLGIPGLLAFLAILAAFGYTIVGAYRACESHDVRVLLVSLGAGVLGYLAYGLTDAFTLGAKPGIAFWAMLGLALAVYLREQRLSNESRRVSIKPAPVGRAGDKE